MHTVGHLDCCVCVCVHFKCGLKHLRVPTSLRMWVIKQAFQTFEAIYLLPSIVDLSLMGRNSLKYKQGLIALVSFLTTLMAFPFLLLLPPSFFFLQTGKAPQCFNFLSGIHWGFDSRCVGGPSLLSCFSFKKIWLKWMFVVHQFCMCPD